MFIQKIRSLSFTCFLALISFAGIGLGNELVYEFVPASSPDINEVNRVYGYYARDYGTTELGYAPASAGANVYSGYVWVYASGWLGGSSSRAWQCVEFDVTGEPSVVEVEVTILYAGDAVNFGPASFSSTAWHWSVDAQPWQFGTPAPWQVNFEHDRSDIKAAFTPEILAEKIIETIGIGLGVSGVDKIREAGEIMEAIVKIYEIAETINKIINEGGDGGTLQKKFLFVAPWAGKYHLWVGISGEADGLGFGAGFAIMFGQIQKIKVTIKDPYGGLPDLIVQSMIVPDPVFGPVLPLTQFQRGESVTFDVAVSDVGRAPVRYMDYSFDVCEPNAADYNNVTHDYSYYNAGGFYGTQHHNPSYTFHKKGLYSFKATVDPRNKESESDENNNEMVKQYYVKGLPPSKPSKPTVPANHLLYRNNSYTFCTSATDPDNDPLKYKFFFYDVDDKIYYSTWSDPNSISGWSDCNCISYITSGSNGEAGTYYVWAKAVDSDGLYSEPSEQEYFVVAENAAPQAPDITAPDGAYTGQTVSFKVSSTDRENDGIGYVFVWGDGTSTTTACKRPAKAFDSVTVTVEHKYSTRGPYYVSVQAIDSLGAYSSVSYHPIGIIDYIPPIGTITVKTNHPLATFHIAGPNEFDGYGTFWATEVNEAKSGTYTITFGDVNYYACPIIDGDSKYLGAGQSITFDGQYRHLTGTIEVNTNNSSASFTVTGHGAAKGQKFSGTGRWGRWTYCNAGEYTIQYGSVAGYCLPATRGEMKDLQGFQTIVFDGRYTRPPVASLSVSIPPRGFAIAGEDVVDFNGLASYSPEPDLGIAKYTFYFGDGEGYEERADTNAPDGNFDGNTIYVYPTIGHYSTTLWVSDTLGNGDMEDVSKVVQVKSRPRARILSIDPSPAIDGETVGFTGKGTDADGDAIIAYEWQSNTDGNLSDAQDFNTCRLKPGIHTISFRVQDSNDLWSAWAAKQLTVYDALKWPMFKKDASRVSNQGSYSGRLHGMLGYGQSWSYPAVPAGSSIDGSPVAANLDGNSVNGLEIAFASVGPAPTGSLYVIDNAGNLIWSKNNIGQSKSTPAIADINNDGNLDIVIGSMQGVYAYNKDGNNIYTFPAPVPGQGFDSTPVVADIDANCNNGKETIIGCNDGKVYAISSKGNLLWAFPSPTGKAFTSSAAVAEIEPNRPGLETVIAGTDGILYVIGSNGLQIASYATPAPRSPIHTAPAIADLNPNQLGPEIVFGSDDGRLYCVNYNNLALHFCWRYATAQLKLVRSSPAIGFMYGVASQVIFGCDDGKVYVLQDNDGVPALMGTFQCGGMVRSTPVIANIDTIHNIHPLYGDLSEVIVGATDGKLYAISFAQGGVGVPLPWSPIPLGIPIFSSPAVADIDHEPDLEILIGASNNLHLVRAFKSAALVPVAKFTVPAVQRVGNPPLEVSFTDQSTNSPISWLWDFGDDCTSTDKDPNHIYNVPGTYDVNLTVMNAHGSNSVTESDYITVYPVPVAAFTYTPVTGTVPLQVNFSDQSQYGPTSWLWNFGDGETSTLQNPSHNYTEPNLYTVTLTVSNTYGSDDITKTDCIFARAPQPDANFTQDVTNGQPPLSVSFTDLSTGQPTSWLWNFGDGNTSEQQNPSYMYESPGNYLVSLTVSNSTGSDTKTNPFYIRVGYNLSDYDHNGIVDFTDLELLVNNWLRTDSIFVADIAPPPDGDGIVNFLDFALFAQYWQRVFRIPPKSLVGHWPFDEGQGTTTVDRGAGRNGGVLMGDTRWVVHEANRGTCLDFDGVGDYVKTQDTTNGLDFAPGSFSVSAWINARGVLGGWRTILEYDRDGSNSNRFGMWLASTGNFHFRVGRDTKNSDQVLNPNQWYLLTGTYDAESKEMDLYINGRFDSSFVQSRGFGAPAASKLTIGVRGSEDAEYFDGKIDDVRIYNYRLTPEEIQALYQGI
jgi:PKD repeat protein